MERQRVARLYELYADTVTRAAWHCCGSLHTAQDCAEEAFLRLMKQEEIEEARALPWLIRTAVNCAKDDIKAFEHSRTVPLDEGLDSETDDQALLAERAAMRAMLSLEERYRLPLYLHLAEGYTILETARLLGKGFNTTASLIRRGKKLLRAAYEREGF
ncbi:MAG: RNA polymerase sigma factor [Ruminococcus sp.]|nr:RNA polymerase sigma factor [Ruminococcus sp.]